MRVLALLTDCFGGRGGIAQYNRDFVTALSLSQDVTEVVLLPRLGKAIDEAVPDKVKQLAPVASRLRYAANAAEVALRRGPFDVVFCGHLYHAPLAAGLARLLGKPMWLQVHGVDAWERPSRLLQAGLEHADLVTAVSRYTRQRILQWAHIDPQKIKVLPNTLRFPIRSRDQDASLPDGLPFAGKPYLLTVARIEKADAYKGHRRVIGVLGRVRERHPDLQYVITGDGNDRGGLEALVAGAGLDDCGHFPGPVPTGVLERLLAPASALVLPRTQEGFGIAFLEAAAYGLPVIAGNVDGSVDALADGAIGLLVDPADPNALFEAISTAVSGRAPAPDKAALARFAAPNFQAHVHALLSTLPAARGRKPRNAPSSTVVEPA